MGLVNFLLPACKWQGSFFLERPLAFRVLFACLRPIKGARGVRRCVHDSGESGVAAVSRAFIPPCAGRGRWRTLGPDTLKQAGTLELLIRSSMVQQSLRFIGGRRYRFELALRCVQW